MNEEPTLDTPTIKPSPLATLRRHSGIITRTLWWTLFVLSAIVIPAGFLGNEVVVLPDGCPPTCIGVDLMAKDLSGYELQKADLSGARLSKANLRNAQLREAILMGATMSDADLIQADLRDSLMRASNMSGANLVQARLEGADMSGSLLDGADLSRLDMTQVKDLNAVSFIGAKLVGTSFNNMVFNGNMEQANLTGSHIQETNLTGVSLAKANLSGTDLTNSRLVGCYMFEAKLNGASLDGANLKGSYLRDAVLSGANMPGVNLVGADLRRADLRGANLEGANLTRANLSGARLNGANLKNSTLIFATIGGADLSGADLRDADLRSVTFFSFATLDSTYFVDIEHMTVETLLTELQIALINAYEILSVSYEAEVRDNLPSMTIGELAAHKEHKIEETLALFNIYERVANLNGIKQNTDTQWPPEYPGILTKKRIKPPPSTLLTLQ